MRSVITFLLLCLVTAAVPFIHRQLPEPVVDAAFPGWPATFEGRPLRELPRSERERRFEQGFPGRIARFTDGRHEIILRWITRKSRTLHPANDCFRGLGYTVTPLPLHVDTNGHQWGAFRAVKGNERLQVRMLIRDNAGHTWSDVSAWYWSAQFNRTTGPWWAYTVAEREQ